MPQRNSKKQGSAKKVRQWKAKRPLIHGNTRLSLPMHTAAARETTHTGLHPWAQKAMD